MQGNHKFKPELFVQIDYEAIISKNHLLRRIAKVLDLRFIKESTKKFYSHSRGRPSIDPEVFFRISILGHIYGIKSDRQLCEELEVNLAYRWFVGLSMSDAVPDHSSLSRVRDRLGVACFQEVFEKIVEQCRMAGLVPGNRIITDASLVEANASARKLERRDKPSDVVEVKAEKRQGKEDTSQPPITRSKKVSNCTHVSKVDGDVSVMEADELAKERERRDEPSDVIEVNPEKRQGKGGRSQASMTRRERVSNRTHVSKVDGDVSVMEADELAKERERRDEPSDVVEVKPEKRQGKEVQSQASMARRERVSNRTHVSKVDGDASLVHRKGYPRKLYHKVHYCADGANRVITDCYVTTGACHENTVITERIKYQQDRFGLAIEEVIADVGYGSGKNYQFFEDHKICSYIPAAKYRMDGEQRKHEGSFKYDKKQDIYKCQAGHALHPGHSVGATKYYHIKKAHCQSCQWRDSCYLGRRHTGLYRNKYKEVIERVRQRQTSQVFKQRMRERSWKIEGLFGEAKEQHGLRRARIGVWRKCRYKHS